MDFKKVLVSFLAIASLLLLTATVSAYALPTGSQYSNLSVKVNGDDAAILSSVNAGDTITVQVKFTVNAGIATDNIKVKATLEGNNDDVTIVTSSFPVEANGTYSKTLTLTVPSDFETDSLNGNFPLTVRIGSEEISLGNLHVQRPAYNTDFVSISADNTVTAGESFPVVITVKNTGYNDLKDLYVTAKIAELNIEKKVSFGDLFNVVTSDSNHPGIVSGTLNLKVPYGAKPGQYSVEVEASNAETSATDSVQITVQNDFPENVVKTATGLLFVNPTANLKVYRVVLPEGEKIVTVQESSTESVEVNAQTEDTVVSVLTLSGDVVGNFTFKASEQPATTIAGSPITVLTVILGIVFFVLLIVLIVLLSKKPQKSEELGESYY